MFYFFIFSVRRGGGFDNVALLHNFNNCNLQKYLSRKVPGNCPIPYSLFS